MAICMSSLEGMSILVFHSFNWIFFFYIKQYELFILEINPLLVASFTNIFSHPTGCLVCLCFPLQKLLNLIRPHLFLFVFISITL